ncbi:hypothetical protein CHS0354_005151 [Potamilus streckersoni]|uniref:Uncharacterized protein n=1 Tax=Potamilus streckersoni TaxID=2493646 RepID=A0AAE0S396_9BIVA|nr:hypothetical protein CHS0354_005151 [Potamilus streckersoni]
MLVGCLWTLMTALVYLGVTGPIDISFIVAIKENFASQMQDSESKLHREADQDHRKSVSLLRKAFNDCWEKSNQKASSAVQGNKRGRIQIGS